MVIEGQTPKLSDIFLVSIYSNLLCLHTFQIVSLLLPKRCLGELGVKKFRHIYLLDVSERTYKWSGEIFENFSNMLKVGNSNSKVPGKHSVLSQAFQVIVVTAVCGSFIFGHVVSFIVMLCNMTNIILLPAILGYLFWFLVYDFKRSSKGGRRWNALRNLSSWNYYRDYFPVRLIKTAQLSPEKNYIFGYHPHGVMCAGAWCNFATEATGFSKLFPGLTPHLLTLKCK